MYKERADSAQSVQRAWKPKLMDCLGDYCMQNLMLGLIVITDLDLFSLNSDEFENSRSGPLG